MPSSDDFCALQHLSSSIIQICEDIQKLLSSLNKSAETSAFSHDVAALSTAVDSAKTAVNNKTVLTSEAFILIHDCEFPLRQAEFTLRTTRDIKAVSTYAEVIKGRTVPLLSLYRRSSYYPEPLNASPPRLPPIPQTAPLTISGSPPKKLSAGKRMSANHTDRIFRNHDMVTKWVSNLQMYDAPSEVANGALPMGRRGTGASAMTTGATVGDRRSKIQSVADVDAIVLRQSQLQAIKAFEEGRLDVAKDIAKSALELAGKLDEKLTLSPPETWKLKQLLVESCLKQENWTEAEELLQLMQGDEGLEEDAKLYIFHRMAEMYYGQGKLEEAESYGWQAWRKRAVLLGMSNPATLDSIRLNVKIKDAKGDVKSAVLEALLQENSPETTIPEGGWDKDRSDSVWTIQSPTTATMRTSSVSSGLFSPTMTSLSSRPPAAGYETSELSPITSHEWLLRYDFTIDAENRLVDNTTPAATAATSPTPTSTNSKSKTRPPLENRRESASKNSREATLVTIFHEAATRGDDKVISLLLGNSTDPNNRPLVPSANVRAPTTKQTALHRAAMKNNISTALSLVGYGADVNASGPEHGSPLHFAAARGHSAMVRLLIEVGANIDAQTKEWPYSPLRVAVSAGRDGVVQDLIARGANLEARDNEGWTPLIAAAKRGRESIVKILLDAGADARAQDRDRWTPLHSAAYGGYENIAKMLIDSGADVTVTHVVGDLMSKKTAWDIAKNRKHYHLKSLLQPEVPSFFGTIDSVIRRRRKSSKNTTLSL